MPGPLVIFSNPKGTELSEGQAWSHVRSWVGKIQDSLPFAKDLAKIETLLAQIDKVAQAMEKQVKRGVHVNPRGLKGDTLMSRHVQAIAYVHAKDGGRYVHGFGNVDPSEDDLKRGILNLDELKETTHVEMVGHADGTVSLIGTKGQPLAALFE